MTRATYAAAVGLAAALLFVVQPMTARFFLPVVGGSSLVWSAALVFFQLALLCGYLLAHIAVRLPKQGVVFVVLLAAAGFATLPFALPEAEPDWSSPSFWVLTQLAIMVGPPFVLLAATSPLLQRWYSWTDQPDAHEPYGLYAASNLGSITGLLAYPFVVEPLAPLGTQGMGWAVGFGLLVLVVGGCATLTKQQTIAATTGPPPDRSRVLWWLCCAAIPSALLVTMTSNITADIAPVPLLWVVPLAVYLGSHVLVFSSRAPKPETAEAVLVACVLPYAALTFFDFSSPWWFFAPLAVAMLAVAAVAYHGELVRTRPPAEHLTTFYLWMAAGGALGGTAATFLAPMLFDTIVELHIELIAAALLLPWVRGTKARTWPWSIAFTLLVAGVGYTEKDLHIITVAAACAVAVVGAAAWGQKRMSGGQAQLAVFVGIFVMVGMLIDPVLSARSAYGRYWIERTENDLGVFHALVVGRVNHGSQARDETLRDLPLSYYHQSGPIGQVFNEPTSHGPVAVIGLGVGGVAAYARDTRPMVFFELDPLVLELAMDPTYFTYLRRCPDCRVEIGDGRIALEAEEDHSFSVMLVDAFAGDAVPTHLLTTEAFELYKSKLRPNGLLLVNASNNYVDIQTVAANSAAATGLSGLVQGFWPREAHLIDLQVTSADWVLLSEDKALIDRLAKDPRWKPISGDSEAAWTDDWQNLFAHYTWR